MLRPHERFDNYSHMRLRLLLLTLHSDVQKFADLMFGKHDFLQYFIKQLTTSSGLTVSENKQLTNDTNSPHEFFEKNKKKKKRF